MGLIISVLIVHIVTTDNVNTDLSLFLCGVQQQCCHQLLQSEPQNSD